MTSTPEYYPRHLPKYSCIIIVNKHQFVNDYCTRIFILYYINIILTFETKQKVILNVQKTRVRDENFSLGSSLNTLF